MNEEERKEYAKNYWKSHKDVLSKKNWQDTKDKISSDEEYASRYKEQRKKNRHKYNLSTRKQRLVDNPVLKAIDDKKQKARRKVRRVEKASYCQICGSKKGLEKHHNDYDLPKVFLTLCKECHLKKHNGNFRINQSPLAPDDARNAESKSGDSKLSAKVMQMKSDRRCEIGKSLSTKAKKCTETNFAILARGSAVRGSKNLSSRKSKGLKAVPKKTAEDIKGDE